MRTILLCVLLAAGSCASAPSQPVTPDEAEPLASPCRSEEHPKTDVYHADEADDVPSQLSDVLLTPPCLDADGEDAACPDRIIVRWIDSVADPVEKDLAMYRESDGLTAHYRSVVGQMSGDGCAWDVDHSQQELGPWVVAGIAGTLNDRGFNGCTPVGVLSVFAVVDRVSGDLAGVIHCMGDRAGTVSLDGDKVVVAGCRGAKPSYSEPELRACVPTNF